MSDWIVTSQGIKFYPLDPRPEDIIIHDIAHALSHQCRFSGHVSKAYTVAEHSVHVSRVIEPHLAYYGLLHDASEAYLVDIPRPLKRHKSFAPYREAEDKLQAMIYERFGLGPLSPEDLKLLHYADTKLLRTEQRDLMPLHPDEDRTDATPLLMSVKEPWPAEKARTEFMARFFELWGTGYFVRRPS